MSTTVLVMYSILEGTCSHTIHCCFAFDLQVPADDISIGDELRLTFNPFAFTFVRGGMLRASSSSPLLCFPGVFTLHRELSMPCVAIIRAPTLTCGSAALFSIRDCFRGDMIELVLEGSVNPTTPLCVQLSNALALFVLWMSRWSNWLLSRLEFCRPLLFQEQSIEATAAPSGTNTANGALHIVHRRVVKYAIV